MTINELLQFSFFRHADICAINEEKNDLAVSFDDEIVDITEIEVGYTAEKYDIVIFPKRFIRVYCVVKPVCDKVKKKTSNFCPNCGADMTGGAENG